MVLGRLLDPSSKLSTHLSPDYTAPAVAPPETTKIAAVIREAGIPFHTDAAQTVGKISAGFEELGVDLPSVAGHNEKDALNHRTTTDPKIRQTGTRVSDRSRYRRLAGRISVLETRECPHLPVEGRGKREARWSNWQQIHSKPMPPVSWDQAPRPGY